MSQKLKQVEAYQEAEEALLPSDLPTWQKMQYKAFHKWCNIQLRPRNMVIGPTLEGAFKDGYRLYHLLELLSKKTVPGRLAPPKSRIQMVGNLGLSFKFLQTEKIRLENIGVEDVVDEKLKLIMGLVWTLILRYQIQKSVTGAGGAAGAGSGGADDSKGRRGRGGAGDGGVKQFLLDWCKCIAHYRDVSVTNLTTSFQDGMAFNAMIHLHNPDLVDYNSLNKGDKLRNLNQAFDILEKEFGVHKIIDAKDMVEADPDEKTVIMYLSSCIVAFDEYVRQKKSSATDPSKSVAYGPGTEVASTFEPSAFTIEARDRQGKKVSKGGDNFQVKLKGPDGSSIDVKTSDNQDGTYSCQYQTQRPGTHTLEVSLDGKPISNMPTFVLAEEDAEACKTANHKWSTVYGPGTQVATTAASGEFFIQAKNKYGNPLKAGGDKFLPKGKNPSGAAVPTELHDNNDGTYKVTYRASVGGDHPFDVTLNNHSIQNCPFVVSVQEKALPEQEEADPKWSLAFGDGLKSAHTSKPATFTIQAKNRLGENLKKGGSHFDVEVTGPYKKPVPAKVTDNQDGTYTVDYQTKASGNHKVNVTLKGKTISNGIVSVPSSQDTDAAKSYAHGAGVVIASTAEPAEFIIQAVDTASNPVTRGGDPFRVQITSSNGQTIKYKIKDKKNGTYAVRYQPTVAGTYTVNVSLKGTALKDSPHKVTVEQNNAPNTTTDSKWSTLSGAGLELASTFETAEFTVRAKNKYGNNIIRGGDAFKVSVKDERGLESPVFIQNNKDGTYDISYRPKFAGNVTVEVFHDDNLVMKQQNVTVEHNSHFDDEFNARWSRAVGPGVEYADTILESEFTIEGRNKYGNRITSNKTPGVIKVGVTDPNDVTHSANSIENSGDGTFAVKYQTKSHGDHDVEVTVDGDQLYNSPFTVGSVQVTDPSSCTVSGGGSQSAMLHHPAEFVITARDSNKNIVNRGGDDFQVRVIAPNGDLIPATIKDNGNGTYDVSYKPESTGHHQIDISLNGVSIGDKPLSVLVEEDPKELAKADHQFTTVYGPQLSSTQEPVQLKIQAKNKYGANLTEGGAEFTVNLNVPKGSAAITPDIIDNKDGTYSCTFQPKAPGQHVIDVMLEGKSINNSPLTLLVTNPTNINEEPSAKTTTASGPGLEKANTAEKATFTVQARNQFGNALKKGGHHITVDIKEPSRSAPVHAEVKDNDDGTYTVSYQPSLAGKHEITVALDGKTIGSGNPFVVNATQTLDPSKCTVSGAGVKIASTAEPSEFIIQARDSQGNKILRGGAEFKPKVVTASGETLKAHIRDNADGTYSVTYQPTTPGTYSIEVTSDNKHVAGSPFKPVVEQNNEANRDLSPTWTVASGAGTELASDYEVSELKVQAKNKYGNNLARGGDKLKVEVKSPNNDALPVNIIDNGDGSYNVSYNPFLPGDHQLAVSLNGQQISENKEPVKVSVDHRTEHDETLDPRWSTAAGPGAQSATTAGQADFLVQARNKYGNKVNRGGAPLKAEAKNTRGLVINSGVKDNNNGTYTVTYVPTESGPHHVSLKVDNQALYRTPLEIDVTQGVDPSKCTVFGAGSSVASTAEPAEFFIQAVDLAGNKVTRGGDKFLVRVQSPAGSDPVVALVVDKKNGTYLVRYHPSVAGPHVITIIHAGSGKAIAASPLKINVDQNQAPDQSFEPKWSNSLGAGIDIGSTAEKAELKLQARNKYGNKLKTGGADIKADVTSSSGSPLNLTVHDNTDGTYTLSYQAIEEGEHKLKLTANGNRILNDLHHLPVDQNKAPADDADPKYTTAFGAGVESATTSEPAVFTIQAKNKYGNNVNKSGDVIKLSVKAPSGSTKPVKTEIKDNGDGTYTVSYQPVAAGDHVLDATMNGVSIYDSPFVVPVTQETDPTKCKATGAGTEIASTAEPATFTIHAYDKAGNHVTRGGDPFKVEIKDPAGEQLAYKIKDNYDGTYSVTYQPQKAGVHTLDASLNGTSITGGNPFKVNVEHNEKPNHDIDGKWSLVDGAGSQIGSTAEKAEFEIQTKNKYGNDLKSGGHPISSSVRTPGGAELPVKVIDNGDGTYKISYNPTIPGEYDLGVKLAAKEISHSTPVVELNDRPSDEADPKWSVVIGPGVTKASVSEPADSTLIAKNRYGNQLKRGGDQVDVRVHSPDKSTLPATTADHGDGTYAIAYKPSALGEHTVDVFLNGERVRKSPYIVPVTSGADASKSEVYGDGIETANVGEPAKFFIQAKDKNWGVIRTGGDNFQVAITDPSGTAVPAQVHDNGDGSYTVTYTPLHAGDHAVHVSLDREPVANVTVVAKQTTDASKTEIKDLPTNAVTFETTSFLVETKDKSGAKLNAGGDDVYAKITPPAGSRAVIAHVVDLGNGDYRVSFVPQVPGDHSIAVSVNQNNVPGSPVSIPVKQSPADPSHCELQGPGFTDATTSHPAVFKLISKDKKGNLLPTGGEPFKATAVNGANHNSVPVELKDNGDGTYGISFKAAEPGTYQLSVTLRDQPINGSTFSVPVKQIVDPSKCAISGDGVTTGVTSQPSTFTIQARDEAGGDVRGGGQSFMVKILDPNGAPIPALIRDNKDGSYSVTYNPYAPGLHTVEVKLDGKPVGDGPFKPDIKAGKATTMSEFETSLWKELNKARVTPQLYAQSMKELLVNYDGLKYKIPGSKYIRMTKEGTGALEEAIQFLNTVEPSPALELSEEFSRSCFDLCDDQGPSGGVGTTLSDGTPADQRLVRYGAWKKKVTEIINYGGLTPQDIVQQWLIDDGVSDRSNRRDVLDPVFKTVGISSGPHAKAMRMTVVSLAGAFVPGDYGEGRTKDRKVHSSRDEFSIERYATPDGKGYLIEGGDVAAKKENLKLMKEGTFLHLYRTLHDEDGEAVVSHFRWQIPFDFDPITATGLLKPNGHFFISLRRPTTLDPNVPHEVTRFRTVAKADADDEILDLKMKQNNTHILIDITPGTIDEDVQVTIQNNILGLNCEREVTGEDEEGEYKQKLTEERSVKLPFPVGLSSFSLEPKEDNTFTLKIAKPQTKPDQQNVEIPVLNF